MAVKIQYTSYKFQGLGLISEPLYNTFCLCLQLEPEAKLFKIDGWSFMSRKYKFALYLALICLVSAFVEPYTKDSKFLSGLFVIIAIPSAITLFVTFLSLMFELRNFLGYKIDANLYHKRLRKSISETSNYQDFTRVFLKRLGYEKPLSRLDELMNNPMADGWDGK